MSFIRFRTVSTILLTLLLLALFWFPQRMLNRCTADWEEKIASTSDALLSGRFSDAQQFCGELQEDFQRNKEALERFLNHDAVDSVATALGEAEILIRAEDAPGALSALAAARGAMEHLLCIERFTWNALL